MTLVVADTHVHLHPCHDAAVSLRALARNLGRLGGGLSAAFLADRAGEDGLGRAAAAAASAGAGISLTPGPGRGAALLAVDGEPPAWLFAGRQAATAERLEVLGLALDAPLRDGLAAAATIEAVIAAGGVPVLCWSPGKWRFSRGHLVRELFARFGPGRLLAGDTAMRPAGAAEPAPIRVARTLGIMVLAGTDPLPIRDDERLPGSYASALEGDFDPVRPLESARALLRSPGSDRGTRGARGTWSGSARRWWAHRRARSAGEAA